VTSETASTRDFDGAEDGIRTRDPHLGKVMRYHCATSAWTTTLSRRPPAERRGSRMVPSLPWCRSHTALPADDR
jgi:hypothetical protein